MRALIDDWLTLAEAEGGLLVRRREPVELTRLIPPLLDTYEEFARRVEVSLSADMPAELLTVLGDRNCLSVLFDNLIVNAIKYNRPGGTVRVNAGLSTGEVVVAVADTGVGIPAAHHHLIFEEFYRLPDPEHGAPPGSGLGLPICRRIVSELGGRIELESEEHVGSTFRVRLPATAPTAAAVAQTLEPSHGNQIGRTPHPDHR
jgi:signal transduction histidine kinase